LFSYHQPFHAAVWTTIRSAALIMLSACDKVQRTGQYNGDVRTKCTDEAV